MNGTLGNLWKLAPLVLGLALPVLPASAQIIIPADRTLLNAFDAGLPGDVGGQIEFLTDPDNNGSFDSTDQSAGFRYQSITGFGTVYDFCTDFYTGEDGDMTYSVSSGFGGIDPARQTQIRALFTNALPGFESLLQSYIDLNGGDWAYNAAYDDEFSDLVGYAGGMQAALWEIIHEQVAPLGVDVADPGLFEATADPLFPTSRAQRALGYANLFLDNIQGTSPAWTDQGGFNYFFADGGDDQDRLWIAVVPEPSSALLGAIGLAALLRRRRA
jgi:hypothetical protein